MLRLAVLVTSLLIAGAASAAEPVRFAVADARQPQLAAGRDGRLFCAFGAGDDLYCARADDGGKSFAAPVKVATLPGLMLGMRRGPRVAVVGDTVVVSAISRKAGDLVAWRSGDGGRTWSGPVRVNGVDRSCREGLHDMTAGADGRIGALWLDLRNDKTELWSAFSSDGGATWGENRLVYRSPGGSICECCHPSLTEADGTWFALWRNNLDGNRDIYVAVSDGSGKTFGEAKVLGRSHWPLPACPMDGGDIAAGQGGSWAVWRRDRTCYATDCGADLKRERRLGTGEQPVVAVTEAGPTFAWIARRPGDLLVLSPGETEPRTIATNAADPCLAVTADGGVVLAWERVADGKTEVFVTRLAGK